MMKMMMIPCRSGSNFFTDSRSDQEVVITRAHIHRRSLSLMAKTRAWVSASCLLIGLSLLLVDLNQPGRRICRRRLHNPLGQARCSQLYSQCWVTNSGAPPQLQPSSCEAYHRTIRGAHSSPPHVERNPEHFNPMVSAACLNNTFVSESPVLC